MVDQVDLKLGKVDLKVGKVNLKVGEVGFKLGKVDLQLGGGIRAVDWWTRRDHVTCVSDFISRLCSHEAFKFSNLLTDNEDWKPAHRKRGQLH